jgi:hypothetical protein
MSKIVEVTTTAESLSHAAMAQTAMGVRAEVTAVAVVAVAAAATVAIMVVVPAADSLLV